MRTIWKFELEVTDIQTVALPKGCFILQVEVQRGTPCLWVECDSEAPKVDRVFAIYGTGHSLPDNPGKYIGSYMLQGGMLVFHLYENV